MVRKNENVFNGKSANSSPSKKDIELAAYYNWLKRGKPMWDPQADWFTAEKQVRS
jgi:hypothetical protein